MNSEKIMSLDSPFHSIRNPTGLACFQDLYIEEHISKFKLFLNTAFANTTIKNIEHYYLQDG